MRDIALTIFVLGMLPMVLMQPHIGALLWAWFCVDNFRSNGGARASVEVSRVAGIASEKSENYRYVVSHVATTVSRA